MTGFRATDHQIRGTNRDAIEESGGIELGVVDRGHLDTAHDLGDPYDGGNTGVTLISVRLLRGGFATQETSEAQFVQCRIGTGVNLMPNEGDRVVVAIPAGYGYSPGCPVIIAICGPNPKALPGQKPNEPVLLGPAHNYVRMDAKGNVSLFTTDDGTETGKSVYAQIRPDGFRFIHPYGKMTLDKTGFHVLHSSGARIDLGAIGGMPPPLDALGSYAKVSAATVSIEAAAVAVGAPGGVPDAVARATSTLAALSALQASVAAINTVVVGLVTALAGFASGGAAPVVSSALGAVGTGLTIPTTAAGTAVGASGTAIVTASAPTPAGLASNSMTAT